MRTSGVSSYDGRPVQVVWPRGVAAQDAHGVANGGANPVHGVHDGPDGLDVAGAEGGGGQVILGSNSKLQVGCIGVGLYDGRRSKGGARRSRGTRWERKTPQCEQ